MPSIRWFPLQIIEYFTPQPMLFLKSRKQISPYLPMPALSAGRSLSAWRKLQGRLIPSLIFVFQTSCFSHFGQEKCESRQQSDQAGLWLRGCRPTALDLVVL